MESPTLLVSAAFAVAAAALYGYVAWVIANRPVGADARLAAGAFVAWWLMLAVSTATGAVQHVAAYLHIEDVLPYVVLGDLSLIAICVALWGLLYYLLYLYTGRRGVWLPLAVFYVAYYTLLNGLIRSGEPTGIIVDRWQVSIEYAADLESNVLWGPVIALLILPQVVGSLAYFRLYFQLDDRTQKYRVAVVSWSIIIWFGSAGLAVVADLGEQDWWQVLSRFIGLAAALAILSAYRPPAWLQKRLKVEPAPAREAEPQ